MSEQQKLICTKMVKIDDGRDQQGRPSFHHERCGLSASEVEVGGTLTKAKAILCAKHKLHADRETFTSENGYPLGKISKEAKKKGYTQPRLPGTGVLSS